MDLLEKYVPGAKTVVNKYVDKAKAFYNNLTELEQKVMEATNHDPWGPHGQAMQDICTAAFNPEGFFQIMGIVDQRLSESPENWRLVYKTLLLLEFMCKRGPTRVVETLQQQRIPTLERLSDRFEYIDEKGKDQGINVRNRAKELFILITDDRRLTDEREKANKNAGKYTGVSSTGFGSGSGGRYGGFAGGAAANSGSTSSYTSSYGTGSSSLYGNATSASGSSGLDSGSRVGSSLPKATSSAATAADEDPTSATAIEATRRRIERLKAEGAIPEAAGTRPAGTTLPIPGVSLAQPSLDEAPGSPKRVPKKLSDIKINPKISAAFAKGGLGLAPSGGSGVSSAASAGDLLGGDVAQPAAATAAAPTASAIDLLGGLDDLAAPVSGTAAAARGAGVASDWDAFTAAPAPAAAGGADEWSSFSAPAAAQPKPAVNFDSLLGPSTTSTTAGGALPADAFSSFGPAPGMGHMGHMGGMPPMQQPPQQPLQQPLQQPQQQSFLGADPFAPMPQAGGYGASVPTMPMSALTPAAVRGSVPVGPGPKLGPETEKAAAKAKDPFADLLG